MTIDATQQRPRSRRALLAGVLGGLGALAAAAVGRVDPTAAAAGDPIRMGRLNKASSTATTLQTKTSAAACLVNQIGAGPAVKGVATSGRAIVGEAGTDGTGVWASSPDHYAVHAVSPGGVAVRAESHNVGIYVQGGAIGVNAHGQTALVGAGSTAALLNGQLSLNGVQHMSEQPEPETPAPNSLQFFARYNAGKTQLCVKFSDGSVHVLAAQP